MKAPSFTLPDQNGKNQSLGDYAGKWLVVYFYPKDDTPGCTVEACAFRDAREWLSEKGLVVIGISKDTVASHKKFDNKHNLGFSLLSDSSTDTIKAFGSWGKKKFMGREYEGIKRNTYLIDPSGEIVKTYENVSPLGHAAKIFADYEALTLA